MPGRLRALLPGLLVSLLASSGAAAERQEPRLALLIVIDQLRADRLDPSLPGGLGRLAREGRVFSDAAFDHANTETCPGHVAVGTGRHPGPIGVPGNQYVDRVQNRVVYCVEDPAESAPVFGSERHRSPRAIQATGVGDWLKRAHPGARVFSVSGKDRAAIALGGQRADAAFWLDRDGDLGWTSSSYYLEALPRWVDRFNGSGPEGGFVGRLPVEWTHETGNPANGARADDFPAELTSFSHTSPHPLRSAERKRTLAQLYASPFLDQVTIDFALELVEREKLGRDDVPDLLAVAPSATDIVGHYYGPWSQESRDALRRLDADLGRLIDVLAAIVGEGRLVVALSADHGVLPIPEWDQAVGHSDCPLAGGRGNVAELMKLTELTLDATFGASPDPRSKWLLAAASRLSVNRERAREFGVEVAEVVARARQHLQAQPGIRAVWTAEEIEAGRLPEPFARLYRNSHHPARGGELAVQFHEDCLFSRYPIGTSHGSPYLYDRAVPVVFWGAGVAAGVVRSQASPVDVAPTLAALLGLEVPADLDGRALPVQ